MKKKIDLLSGYKKSIYYIFSYFLICAFAGWIFETTFVLITTGHFTNRGLFLAKENFGFYFKNLKSIPVIRSIPVVLGLPIIGMYGLGGCFIVFSFSRLAKRPILLFFIGMVSMTILEYISGAFCVYIMHKTYWDYSKEFLNFQGIVCLSSSLAWGALSVFTILFLKSKLALIYTHERKIKNYKKIIIAVMIYTAICIVCKYLIFK